MPFDGTNFEQQDAKLTALRKAREQLAKPGGWCQGVGFGFGGAKCIGAALYQAVGYGADPTPLFDLVAADLPDNGTVGPLRIILWDHMRVLTWREVVALVDTVIARRMTALGEG